MQKLFIRELRAELKLSLEMFGLGIGVASRGQMSKIERGVIAPTVTQALAIEALAEQHGIAFDAAALNADVAAARAKFEDGRTHDATSSVDDEPADLVIITCSVCDQRDTAIQRRGCQYVDCPHSDVVGDQLGSASERLAA